jgi:glycosyltransferase involved in cell wall biosynthesis
MITVILPVHNGSNYLASSIASVLAQDCDFILHVLDDGSTDASAEIAQSTRDPRVRYSRNPAKFGLFKTLNRGFTEATTSLVRIWAHDDLMLPGSLHRFVEFAENRPEVGMIYSDFWAIDTKGYRTRYEERFEGQRERTPECAHWDLSALLFYSFGCLPGNISTVLLRREAWHTAGGFLEGMQQAPDYDMWVRISEFSSVGFIKEKLIELRDHPLQLSKVGTRQMTTISEEFPICQKLQQHLSRRISQTDLRSFWRQHRGRQHFHWIMKALLAGNFGSAERGWASLKEYEEPFSQFLFWLISLNGRFLAQDREVFFDQHAPQSHFS